MKRNNKQVRITEEQLHKALTESLNEINFKHAAAAALGAAALAGGVATCNHECNQADGYKDPQYSDQVGRYALNSPNDADLYNSEFDSDTTTYDPIVYDQDTYREMTENSEIMGKILRESISKVLNEISDDTIDRA